MFSGIYEWKIFSEGCKNMKHNEHSSTLRTEGEKKNLNMKKVCEHTEFVPSVFTSNTRLKRIDQGNTCWNSAGTWSCPQSVS